MKDGIYSNKVRLVHPLGNDNPGHFSHPHSKGANKQLTTSGHHKLVNSGAITTILAYLADSRPCSSTVRNDWESYVFVKLVALCCVFRN